MTRLSACYFCGIAMDEPLADYPIVPSALRGDDTRTVTLCPSCHQKLDAIMDVVSEAVADTGELDLDDALGDEPVRASADAGEDAELLDPAEPSSADDPADTEADPGAVEQSAADAETTDPETADADDGSTSVDDGSTEVGDDATEADDDATEVDDDATEADDDATEADDGADGDADSAKRSVVEGQHSISALEYNRVMRLLQNREFPVDRQEIETVAANAYGLARSDCAKVIDLAVDRGLIEEADGQLHRAGDA